MYEDQIDRINSADGVSRSSYSPLSPVLADLMSEIKPMGYTAGALIRPKSANSGQGVYRSLEVSSSAQITYLATQLMRGPGRESDLCFTMNLSSDSDRFWCEPFCSLGFMNALIIRIPVVGLACYEFNLFSTSPSIDDSTENRVMRKVMTTWRDFAATIREEICPLTARERESLRAIAAGMTGAEAAASLNVTERTIRLHVENAKRKLDASNATHAAHIAHLLCAI